MSITIGKIKTQQKNLRGWLVGQFMTGEFHDDNVEIFCKEFLPGDTSDKLHYHPIGTEYLFVIKGKIRFKVGNEILSLKSGDYLKISNQTRDQLLEVLTKTTIFGIRYPSVPNNKVFV